MNEQKIAAPRPGKLTTEQRLPSDEQRFVEALARGEDPAEIGKRLGWPDWKVEDKCQSSQILTAVAAVGLGRLHSQLVPRAMEVLSCLMRGVVPFDQKSYFDQKTVVPPAVQLQAAQTVLKIARLEEVDRREVEDLTDMSPAQLRAIVDSIEARLGDLAAPVSGNAPDDVPDAEIVRELPSNYSVLD